jgi:hypothetical protein
VQFLEKGKQDSQMRRQGRNRRQVPLPDKGMGVGTTTFMALCRTSTVGYPENPAQDWRENPAEINAAHLLILPSNNQLISG